VQRPSPDVAAPRLLLAPDRPPDPAEDMTVDPASMLPRDTMLLLRLSAMCVCVTAPIMREELLATEATPMKAR